jgi:hypothetical protein
MGTFFSLEAPDSIEYNAPRFDWGRQKQPKLNLNLALLK